MPVGALGREALDAGIVAGGAGIKPDAALHREPLDSRYMLRPLDVPRRVLSWPAQTGGVFWDRELSITGHNPASLAAHRRKEHPRGRGALRDDHHEA
jgi:hypothetical protein